MRTSKLHPLSKSLFHQVNSNQEGRRDNIELHRGTCRLSNINFLRSHLHTVYICRAGDWLRGGQPHSFDPGGNHLDNRPPGFSDRPPHIYNLPKLILVEPIRDNWAGFGRCILIPGIHHDRDAALDAANEPHPDYGDNVGMGFPGRKAEFRAIVWDHPNDQRHCLGGLRT